MVYFVEGFVSIFYSVNSALHAWHFPFSLPMMPIIKIFPIVPHFGHKPVVMFFGPLALGFTVFLLTINSNFKIVLLSLSVDRKKRGEWDSNPRVLADMGLAIPRPTRLGDPRTSLLKFKLLINLGYFKKLFFSKSLVVFYKIL